MILQEKEVHLIHESKGGGKVKGFNFQEIK